MLCYRSRRPFDTNLSFVSCTYYRLYDEIINSFVQFHRNNSLGMSKGCWKLNPISGTWINAPLMIYGGNSVQFLQFISYLFLHHEKIYLQNMNTQS